MNNLNDSLARGKQQFAESLVEIKSKEDAHMLSVSRQDWPEPRRIKTELQPVEKFSAALLPEYFGDWVIDVSHRMQCPPDFVAVALVIVAATVIGSGCQIRPKKVDESWSIVPNLWGCIIGKPGVMKSPTIEEALKFLNELESKDRREHGERLESYELDNTVYEARRDALRENLKKAAKSGEEPEIEAIRHSFSLLAEPEKPVCKRLKTNDATVEKLGELLSTNKRGILISRDELMGLLMNWEREDRAQDRAFFLEAWNGVGSFTVDRISRGTVTISNMCISLLGGTQPSKIVPYLAAAKRGTNNDGLIQRFQLMVYPDDIQSWSLVDQRRDAEARRKVSDALGFLASCNDFTVFGATVDGEGETPYLRFDAAAQKVFYDWLTALETKKLRGEDADNEEPLLIEHLSKYRSLMPSLALIIHLLDECSSGKPPLGAVSKQAAEMAVAWCEYLESHARRAYGMVANIADKAASKLSLMIEKGKLSDGFTVRDVYKKEWQYLTKETTQDAVEELLDAGWLREYLTQDGNNRHTRRFLINPKARKRSEAI